MDSGQGPVWSGVGTRNVQKLQISSNPYRGLRCFPYNNSLACWGASKNLTYGIPPQPMPTTKGQQNLNRSLVVGAGKYPITGCAREHEFSRFLPSPWKKLALTTDATWIGPDWIDQSQWLTKQQKDRDRVTGVEQTQSNPGSVLLLHPPTTPTSLQLLTPVQLHTNHEHECLIYVII